MPDHGPRPWWQECFWRQVKTIEDLYPHEARFRQAATRAFEFLKPIMPDDAVAPNVTANQDDQECHVTWWRGGMEIELSFSASGRGESMFVKSPGGYPTIRGFQMKLGDWLATLPKVGAKSCDTSAQHPSTHIDTTTSTPFMFDEGAL